MALLLTVLSATKPVSYNSEKQSMLPPIDIHPSDTMKKKSTNIIKVKPYSYQPSKAEREELVKIEATPDEVALAVLSPAKVVKSSKS